ncbi:uncharacterized protein LOC132730619 [Ruditapes philippinarum]|uniref:uncharacterized protein LOC132730619 n=1 Tax=Ruditapes philippinarum TaxID=129788 RepID=UPI00295BAA85|nr:uncharacterized protein LOC132730619 [Ruditapes philippinarum]
MNKMVYLGCLALASCVGMAIGYGSVMTGHNKFNSYPYMGNMGYGPYMAGSSGFGGFLGGTGGSSSGMGGIFGNIIQLFLFIFVINILFSSTGLGSGLGSGGLGIGKKSSHVTRDYDFY